ncbi:MAG TPA: endonuclease MutS2, partial [Treponema sp.]|nr:endonuclease MutS2 [Treponema sp.]
VQFGSLKMSVPQTQLVPVSPAAVPSAAPVVIETAGDGKDADARPKFELRLLGMRYEEAMKALERQLDLCTIYNFREFSVIHGKGSGVLQQGVQNYLSHYPGVKEFHFAQPEDGGSGKTYVSLY